MLTWVVKRNNIPPKVYGCLSNGFLVYNSKELNDDIDLIYINDLLLLIKLKLIM